MEKLEYPGREPRTIEDIRAYIHFQYAQGRTADELQPIVAEMLDFDVPYSVYKEQQPDEKGDYADAKAAYLLEQLAPKNPI